MGNYVIADPSNLGNFMIADSTCHLVEITGARQTNISNHLRVLREAGVVEAHPAGRFTYYRLRPEVLERLARQFGELAQAARAATAVRRACD